VLTRTLRASGVLPLVHTVRCSYHNKSTASTVWPKRETDGWTESGALMDEMRDKLHPGSEQPPSEEDQPSLVPEADSAEEEAEEGAEAEVPQIDEGN
jgi:hypothetical protein